MKEPIIQSTERNKNFSVKNERKQNCASWGLRHVPTVVRKVGAKGYSVPFQFAYNSGYKMFVEI